MSELTREAVFGAAPVPVPAARRELRPASAPDQIVAPAGSLSRRLWGVVAAIAVVDAAVLALTSFVAVSMRAWLDGMIAPSEETLVFSIRNGITPWLFLAWFCCLVAFGAYARRNLGGGFEEFRIVAMASGIAAGAGGTLAFLTQSYLSRGYFIVCFAGGTAMLLTGRYLVRKALHFARSRGRLAERVVAVGSPAALGEIQANFDRLHWTGYTLVGACMPGAAAPRGNPSAVHGVPVFGGTEHLVAACEATGADTVLVAGGGHESAAALREIGWALEGHQVNLVVAPALLDIAGPRIHMRQVGGMPLVYVDKPQVSRAQGLLKRSFDLAVASAMLLAAAPVMVLAAIAIKLEDRGPVFYRQERSGRDGVRFGIWKFRSMVVNADALRDDLVASSDTDGVLFKMKEDPRITRVGKWLRRFSVDELPQLFNVIRGEMSVVGPRPPLPAEVEAYPAHMHRRLLVRPGLTGLWQVSGRSDLPFDEAVRMDLYYVDNWSLIGDILIMLKTVRAVLLSKGAY
ncbi:sugar transferase [Nocardioides sp. Bht2]|uniref:sugar transferase n=1 Tax=Nocardioides sp. Bht2 TaxID=3392297 RepID=UPI0039B6CDA9